MNETKSKFPEAQNSASKTQENIYIMNEIYNAYGHDGIDGYGSSEGLW